MNHSCDLQSQLSGTIGYSYLPGDSSELPFWACVYSPYISKQVIAKKELHGSLQVGYSHSEPGARGLELPSGQAASGFFLRVFLCALCDSGGVWSIGPLLVLSSL